MRRRAAWTAPRRTPAVGYHWPAMSESEDFPYTFGIEEEFFLTHPFRAALDVALKRGLATVRAAGNVIERRREVEGPQLGADAEHFGAGRVEKDDGRRIGHVELARPRPGGGRPAIGRRESGARAERETRDVEPVYEVRAHPCAGIPPCAIRRTPRNRAFRIPLRAVCRQPAAQIVWRACEERLVMQARACRFLDGAAQVIAPALASFAVAGDVVEHRREALWRV